MATRTSPFLIERVVALSQQGHSIMEVAERTRLSINTVQRYRRLFGVKTGRERPARAPRVAKKRPVLEDQLFMCEQAAAALIGPPYPYGPIRRCAHELPDGECATCEREQRRFIEQQEKSREEECQGLFSDW